MSFLLLNNGRCRGRLGHDRSKVDFVLLADVFKHFGREVLEHFLQYLNSANKLPVFIFPLYFPEDVIFVVGFGIIQTLFAGNYVLLDQILEALFDSQLNILRHDHHSGLVSEQFALNLVQHKQKRSHNINDIYGSFLKSKKTNKNELAKNH